MAGKSRRSSKHELELLETRRLLCAAHSPIAPGGHDQSLAAANPGVAVEFDGSHIAELRPDLINGNPPGRSGQAADIVWTNRASTTTGGAADTDGFGVVF